MATNNRKTRATATKTKSAKAAGGKKTTKKEKVIRRPAGNKVVKAAPKTKAKPKAKRAPKEVAVQRIKFENAAAAKEAEVKAEALGLDASRSGRALILSGESDTSAERKLRSWASKNGYEIQEPKPRGRPRLEEGEKAERPARGGKAKKTVSAADRQVEGKTRPILRVTVDSSNIDRAAYNFISERLTVVFKNGNKYVYREVTMEEFLDFVCAKSQGSFLNEHIKPTKPFNKVKDK